MSPEPNVPRPDPAGARRPDTEAEASSEDRRVAGSPHAVAANGAMLALTRAARSFTLYDPSNKVVRTLIADYRDKLQKVLTDFGSLALEVHPYELLLGNEIVYSEADRERSLAFRLFRDGVRRIAFAPGTTWEELLRLLQILSIRYTGVRQQEDDLVTLLRKAAFAHLTIDAIEGFVPEEVLAEPSLGDVLRGDLARREPPEQWDLPLPPFRETVPLRYRPVPEEFLERLRAEESEDTVPRTAVRVVAELLRTPLDVGSKAVLGLALEVREYLLVEKRADLVTDLGRVVLRGFAAEPEATRAFLTAYLDARTLATIVHALPPDAELPPQVLELLEALPAEPLGHLLDLLAEEGAGRRADALRTVLVTALRRAPEVLAARLRGAQGQTAGLLKLLAEVDPKAAFRTATDAAGSADADVQKEALRQIAAAPFGPETARALNRLVESPFEEVRIAALPALARGGARAFPALQARAEKGAAAMRAAEADAVGRALAEASPRSALALFESWLAPKSRGFLSRFVKMQAPPAFQRVALAGLRGADGEQAQTLLELLADRGETTVAAAAAGVLQARARRVGGRRG
jgi:hypothetical protein